MIFAGFFLDVGGGGGCVLGCLLQLGLQNGEEFFPVANLGDFVFAEFAFGFELLQEVDKFGLAEGGFIGDGVGFVPLVEDGGGGVFVEGVGLDSFEELVGVLSEGGGLFGVGVPDYPVVVNMNDGLLFGLFSSVPFFLLIATPFCLSGSLFAALFPIEGGFFLIPISLGDGSGGFGLFLADAVFELVNLLLGLGLLVADLLLEGSEGSCVIEFGVVFV